MYRLFIHSPIRQNLNLSQNQQSMESIELLTIDELAELLKISKSSVRRLQQGRHLPFMKVGGLIRFTKNDIVEFLKEARVEPIKR